MHIGPVHEETDFRDVSGCVLQLCPLILSNPTPGIVINRPNGSDVYKGVLKDYTGEVRWGAGGSSGDCSFPGMISSLSRISRVRTS